MKTEVTYGPFAESVDLGGGVRVPREITATFTPTSPRDEPPFPVTVRVGFDGEQYVCVELTCHAEADRPLTTDLLRRVPVQGMVRLAVISAAKQVSVDRETGPASRYDINRVAGGKRIKLIEFMPDVTSQGPTDEALRAVATIYRLAHAVGDPPTRAVEDELRLSRATAGRWIAKAREKGFLGQTRQGRAGGTDPGGDT